MDSKCKRLLEWGPSWWGVWQCQYVRMCNERGYPEYKVRLWGYAKRMATARSDIRNERVVYRHNYSAQFIVQDIIGLGETMDGLMGKARREGVGPVQDRLWSAANEVIELWFEAWNVFEKRLVKTEAK